MTGQYNIFQFMMPNVLHIVKNIFGFFKNHNHKFSYDFPTYSVPPESD